MPHGSKPLRGVELDREPGTGCAVIGTATAWCPYDGNRLLLFVTWDVFLVPVCIRDKWLARETGKTGTKHVAVFRKSYRKMFFLPVRQWSRVSIATQSVSSWKHLYIRWNFFLTHMSKLLGNRLSLQRNISTCCISHQRTVASNSLLADVPEGSL